MATALGCFRLTARCYVCKTSSRRCMTKSIEDGRAFSTTPLQYKNEKSRADALKRAQKTLGGRDLKDFEAPSLTPEDWKELDHAQTQEMTDRIRSRYPAPTLPQQRRKLKDTFMNQGDPEPWEVEDAEEDDHDDLSSLAHGELEQHREMRHYARLAAWEMPLLSKLAKPFIPPTADMPLRFRYTTYMGEQHPAEKKVVMEFATADMPDLTPIQREKLKKLVGVRYNPEKDIVKMSCEMFETQAQNKRYLGDMVDSLLKEARDPTDTFEDVPLDLRHHRFKPKPKFPKEWIMTEERRQDLVKYRQQMAMKDQQRELTGRLIDGIKQIEEGLARPAPAREALPEMAMSGRGGKQVKGKRVTVRR